MCRTVHAIIQTVLCVIQMVIRVIMTVVLMLENIIRMVLQNIYNLISCVLQTLSLIPICLVFLLTSRLKCCLCSGGGPCPINRGGCDCLVSIIVLVILFFIFRATGVLDKIFQKLGYAKAFDDTALTPSEIKDVTENFSGSDPRDDSTDYDFQLTTSVMISMLSKDTGAGISTAATKDLNTTTTGTAKFMSLATGIFTEGNFTVTDTENTESADGATTTDPAPGSGRRRKIGTTVLYYLV